MIDDRPGTSFTSKRQVQSEQRKRQLNIGTLETDDKRVSSVRPQTHEQPRIRNRIIPQTVLHDRETLYEEVMSLKNINNNLTKQKQTMETRCKQIESEMLRVLKYTPTVDTINNQLDSFYQEPIKIQKTSHLVIDLKKQLRKCHEELKLRDQHIAILQRNQKQTKYREIESELLAYQNETVRLKSLISVMMNEEYHRYDENTQDLIMTLKRSNIELNSQLQLTSEQLKNLGIKCKEYETKAVKYLGEKVKRDKLIEFLKNQVETLKFRDPELKKQSKTTEQEQVLKVEIEQKQQQIDMLINSLRNKEMQFNELDKRIKEQEKESSIAIDMLERDKQTLKEQIISMKEEMAQSSGRVRRQTQQITHFESKLESLVENDEVEEVQVKKQIPVVSKEDVITIAREIRYRLRLSRVPLQTIDRLLFLENSTDISIEELTDTLQNQPFSLNENDALKLSRYLVEDDEERMIGFSMQAVCNVARVRSIFKNLIGSYQILDASQEDQLFTDIALILSKFRMSLEDYLLRVKKRPDKCSQEDLEESLKFVESSLNSSQMDYLLLKNYERNHQILMIDYKYIFQHFHVELTKRKSQSDIDMNKISENTPPPAKHKEPTQTNHTSNYKNQDQFLDVPGKSSLTHIAAPPRLNLNSDPQIQSTVQLHNNIQQDTHGHSAQIQHHQQNHQEVNQQVNVEDHHQSHEIEQHRNIEHQVETVKQPDIQEHFESERPITQENQDDTYRVSDNQFQPESVEAIQHQQNEDFKENEELNEQPDEEEQYEQEQEEQEDNFEEEQNNYDQDDFE